MDKELQGSSSSSSISYGDRVGGGIVFYLDESRRHGLVAALVDSSVDVPDRWDKRHSVGQYRWSTGQRMVKNETDYAWRQLNAADVGMGQGAENTRKILLKYPPGSFRGSAAAIAAAYRGGGFCDWFLPSREELNELFLNRSFAGGFAATGYWSSSESSAMCAWYQNFKSGVQYNTFGKDNLKRVRAVRAF
ncbi:DUF1566 domain-containing protein [Pelodictyon luteolum]|uniref:Legionella vir region protein n=1 Tax=Chlorobium luteolum (strain DSM 273 / BCRC 81028 / 2530) TaxID=319225 RepID=Q3B4N5_CHLL3|nr:DUF1566 domain-containing protein [Pelodictyon luteolum]ABB23696.1 Legionella vir region protein [Pelodictyon luteolum DSM 273]